MKQTSVSRVLPLSLLLLLLLEAAVQPCQARSVGDTSEAEADKVSKSSSKTTREENEIGDCLLGSDIRDTCEKCAKSTRAMLAFPLCCAGSVNVRNWCQDFLSYTLNAK